MAGENFMHRNVITKRCSICRQNLPLKKFSPSEGGQFGVVAGCKVCINAIAREKYTSQAGEKKKIRIRQRGKEGHYGQVNRKIVAKKLWLYRARLRELKSAGIDIEYRGSAVQNYKHAERIDDVLNKAGLGDNYDFNPALQ
jgi:hypothetical protein